MIRPQYHSFYKLLLFQTPSYNSPIIANKILYVDIHELLNLTIAHITFKIIVK